MLVFAFGVFCSFWGLFFVDIRYSVCNAVGGWFGSLGCVWHSARNWACFVGISCSLKPFEWCCTIDFWMKDLFLTMVSCIVLKFP